MSEPQPTIPQAEKPQQSDDETLSLEEKTLDKQAKSAPYRDVIERRNHLDTLNKRIDVLQGKLDKRESELDTLRPKLAKHEQSSKMAKVLVRDGTVIFVVGGMLVSGGGLFTDGILRFSLAAAGGALVVTGLWIAKVLNRNVWPPDE